MEYTYITDKTSRHKQQSQQEGHIAHLRNQFKSMNTFERSYDYIYYKIGPVVQEEKIFKCCDCTFSILLLSPNVKRCGLSI